MWQVWPCQPDSRFSVHPTMLPVQPIGRSHGFLPSVWLGLPLPTQLCLRPRSSSPLSGLLRPRRYPLPRMCLHSQQTFCILSRHLQRSRGSLPEATAVSGAPHYCSRFTRHRQASQLLSVTRSLDLQFFSRTVPSDHLHMPCCSSRHSARCHRRR